MAKYTVLTQVVEEITRKVNRIANKCRKANVPFIFNVGNSYQHPVHIRNTQDNGYSTYMFNFTDIEIDCQFRHNGWHVLGCVQRKDGILQCFFDNAELLNQYKDTDFHCDHCQKRVHRNSVVILENENTKERKVVGTSCVKEFTRGLDGNLIVSLSDLTEYLKSNVVFTQFYGKNANDLNCVSDMDEEWFRDRGLLGGIHRCYDIKKVVSCAASLIREYGFHSSQEEDKATWKFILDTMDRYTSYVTEEDEREAEDAINWILNLNEDEQNASSYIFNLYQICKNEYCTSRYFGFLASLIPAYRKANVSKKVKVNSSDYVGNIGDKITSKVVITKILCFDSMYGTCYIILMKDSNGNILKWKTSKPLNALYKEGTETTVTGTVKDHDEYRGEKQTSLTRCKFSEIVEENKFSNGTGKVEEAITEFLTLCG